MTAEPGDLETFEDDIEPSESDVFWDDVDRAYSARKDREAEEFFDRLESAEPTEGGDR